RWISSRRAGCWGRPWRWDSRHWPIAWSTTSCAWPTAAGRNDRRGRARVATAVPVGDAGTARRRDGGRCDRRVRPAAGGHHRPGGVRRARRGHAGAAPWRPGRTPGTVAGGSEGSAPAARRGAQALALLLVVLGQVAEAAHALGQLLVLLLEVVAFPAGNGVVLEPDGQVLHVHGTHAVGTLRGGVVPAIVMEGIGDRRRAQEHLDLLPGHPDLQLVHRRLVEQVALVDRLLVQDAAAGDGAGDGGGEQEGKAHAGWRGVLVVECSFWPIIHRSPTTQPEPSWNRRNYARQD